MGCPHSGKNTAQERGVGRRQFLLAAVAIGGTSALSACIGWEDDEPAPGNDSESNDIGNGSNADDEDSQECKPNNDEESLEEIDSELGFIYKNIDKERSQYAWNNYSTTDEKGVPQPPRHHIVVMADYRHDGVPTAEHRQSLEQSLMNLEQAYEWSNEGLLFTVGYSPKYFERFDTMPPNVNLPKARALSSSESPSINEWEISIHLASDYAQAVLGAEEALFSQVSKINGTEIEHSAEDILIKRERRTGFIGQGLPAENQNVEGIPETNPVPEEAPLFMGFHTQAGVEEEHPFHGKTEDTFVHNQNSEYGVMIKEGPFRGGTTQHVSKLRLELYDWYENHSIEERVRKMFAVQTEVEFVGEFGEHSEETMPFPGVEKLKESMKEEGKVGHATKVAQARENGVSPLLRRDFNTTDDNRAGVHFVSLQEEIEDFVRTRKFMNGEDLAQEIEGVGERENNGILEFVHAESRDNFLIPPRNLRALPESNPERSGDC